jgi:FlgD Ig-like domain
VALGGAYQGEGTRCESTVCSGLLGACCLRSGECVVMDRLDCPSVGVWQGAGTICGAYECNPQTFFQREMVVRSPNAVGRSLSIGVDVADVPAILYWELPGFTGFARKTGGAWTLEKVDPDAERGYWWSDMAIDREGRAHITYMVGLGEIVGGSDAIRYAVKHGAKWTRETAVAPYLGVAAGNAIALRQDGTPCIAYGQFTYDTYGSEHTNLMFAEKQGGMWRFELIEEGGYALSCGDSRVAIDSTGDPHVMYRCGAGARYAYRRGGAWTIESVAPIRGTGFTLDAEDRPHLAYHDPDLGGLTYAVRTAGGWIRELVLPTPDAQTAPARMNLGAGERPHVCFAIVPDDPNEATLHYARKEPSGWVIQAIDVRPGAGYQSRTAVLDSRGDLHVAYMEWIEKDAFYARRRPGTASSDGAGAGNRAAVAAMVRSSAWSLIAWPNPIDVGGLWITYRAPLGEAVDLDVYDVGGRRIASIVPRAHPEGGGAAYWHGFDDSGTQVAAGTYFLHLTSASGHRMTEKVTIIR